jgi:YHS domain-containing protein
MIRKLALKTGIILAGILLMVASAYAANYNLSNVGANGYDVVAYFKDGKAIRGTGWHVAVHEGTTYLFASKKYRNQFVKAPEKYLPQFGGFCAFGVAMGKKFYADPTVWKIVEGKLYLNLDKKIQKKWEGHLSENLEKGYANWPKIQNNAPVGI